MKSYLAILASLVLFSIVIFAIGCEPEAAVEVEKPIVTPPAVKIEPAQPAPKPQAEETAKPEVAKPEITEPIAVEPVQPEPSQKPTESAPVEIVDTGVAVTVDGVDITEIEIEEKIKPQIERLGQQAAQMPPNYLEQYKKQMRDQALDGMIIEMLLDKKVKANNIIVTDEDADSQLAEMAAQQKMTLDDLKALLEAKGQNLDETKQRIKKGMRYQKLVEAEFEGKINVTEEDAQKHYSENKARFETPEQVKASHILLKTGSNDPNADTEQIKKDALEKAQNLLKQIKQGADFATLAKEHSEGPSGPKGGDLGFFGAGQMVKEFEEAAFALKIGQVSDIVETRFGYHIIKLTDRKEAAVTLFADAKDGIIEQLENQKKGELAREYVESLKAAANIIYPPGKEPAPRPMMPPRGRSRQAAPPR